MLHIGFDPTAWITAKESAVIGLLQPVGNPFYDPTGYVHLDSHHSYGKNKLKLWLVPSTDFWEKPEKIDNKIRVLKYVRTNQNWLPILSSPFEFHPAARIRFIFGSGTRQKRTQWCPKRPQKKCRTIFASDGDVSMELARDKPVPMTTAAAAVTAMI